METTTTFSHDELIAAQRQFVVEEVLVSTKERIPNHLVKAIVGDTGVSYTEERYMTIQADTCEQLVTLTNRIIMTTRLLNMGSRVYFC